MLQLMLQKILHKKWMIASLIIGNVLLIAIAASNPLYRDAALTNMLQSEFTNYIDKYQSNPALIDLTAAYRKNDSEHSAYEKIVSESAHTVASLGVKTAVSVRHDYLNISTAVSLLGRADQSTEDFKVKIGSLQDLPEHAKIVSGEMYHDELDAEGRIEAVVSMAGFVDMNLLVGEEYEFLYLKDEKGQPLHVVIVGVITNAEAEDSYWINSPDSYTSEFFISEKIFDSLVLQSENKFNYDTHWYTVFDYTALRYSDVPTLYSRTKALIKEGALSAPRYQQLLEDYVDKEQRISVTLTILMVPVLVLLCAFLYMLSNQLLDMEESEISLFKSRGASRKQILRLYFMQSGFLAGVGVLLGLPLGALITKAIGSASAFLEFVNRRPLQLSFTWELLIYTAAAVIISILMTILPVLRQSRVSIVNQKRARARSKRPFWQKMFLDVILIAVSMYGFYNFYRTQDSLTASVMSNSSLDPLLFLSSSLFIIGCSLLCLRILPLIARILYGIRKKHLSPAAYASFLEIIRAGQKRYFIMTFLMLTVSLGIFNTTVARTIEKNTDQNNAYLVGTDLRIQETWKSNLWQTRMDPSIPLVYEEPDFGKYGSIEGVQSVAQVYIDDKASVGSGRDTTETTVYGISTKDFGLTTGEHMPSDVLPYHYYEYLNELAVGTDLVLVSSNFRDVMDYSIGDSIIYTTDGQTISATIVDFIDYFPGYDPDSIGLNPDGTTYSKEQFLIVGHLSTIQKATGIIPYEVWLNFEEDNTDSFYTFVADNKVSLSSHTDLSDLCIETRRDPLYEGTNGILTMSFMIVLILCLVGYLIYWILSIRSRELLFGIFRAMGMSRREIISMLINEQIYASIAPIVAGIGIGIGATRLFVPMIQTAYASTDQVLPLELITQSSDMVRLFIVIGLMLIVGLFVLIRMIARMKLNEALKLGED